MALRKEDLLKRRRAWQRTMHALARELGEDHWITQGMGSVAWGRYDGECEPDESVSHVAMGWGFLQGVRYALLQVAREPGCRRKDEHVLARIHDRMRNKE